MIEQLARAVIRAFAPWLEPWLDADRERQQREDEDNARTD